MVQLLQRWFQGDSWAIRNSDFPSLVPGTTTCSAGPTSPPWDPPQGHSTSPTAQPWQRVHGAPVPGCCYQEGLITIFPQEDARGGEATLAARGAFSRAPQVSMGLLPSLGQRTMRDEILPG